MGGKPIWSGWIISSSFTGAVIGLAALPVSFKDCKSEAIVLISASSWPGTAKGVSPSPVLMSFSFSKGFGISSGINLL